MHKAEVKLKEAGIKKLFIGRDPWHYFPGIPIENQLGIKWAVKQGFESQGKDYDMLRYFQDGDSIDSPTFTEYELRTASKEEQAQLLFT